MDSQKVKTTGKKSVFVLEAGDNYLKIIKCRLNKLNKKEFIDFETETFSPGIGDKETAEKINVIFEKLGYNNNRVILSLPRYQATCRYIKVPASSPGEIEKIIPFQATKYLPYQTSELITSYQVVSTDKEGYSHINLNIAHKDTIERYLNIINTLGVKKFEIVLSSYGLCNLYNELEQKDSGVTMVIELDNNHAELIMVSQKKLLFSRSFKISRQEKFEELLFEEIKKTNTAYLRETGGPQANNIIIFTNKNVDRDYLSEKMLMQVDIVKYLEKIKAPSDFSKKIQACEISPASLIGLALKEVIESLNILPVEVKEENKKIIRRKKIVQGGLRALLVIFIIVLAAAKNFDNKKLYRDKLKIEIDKISGQARVLEEIERRFNLAQSQSRKALTTLDIIYELHKVMPEGVYLSNLTYEETGQIILRGQSPDLNSALELVSGLEKSNGFNDFSVKMRYATKKRTSSGEIIDFEIVCAKQS